MISLEGLTKRFGPLTAVDDVNLSVSRGDVLGFLGPNGAGKSTTMKMVTGFLLPTAGKAFVCGFDVEERPIEAKQRIGYLPEGAPLYGDMTPRSFLDFIADIRGLRGAEKARRVDEAISKVEIAEVLEQRIETLSKGFKRRVGLAQAILHDPEVLILDEPITQIDSVTEARLNRTIARVTKGKTTFIIAHRLSTVERADRIVAMVRGRVVSRDMLMESMYNRKATPFDRSIDMHVSHLRTKLEKDRTLIQTIRGAGYQFCNTSEEAAS